jgi:thiol-disulfide isomerase/thioredoxin
MQISPLKVGLIAMPLFGVSVILYWLFSAMDSGDQGLFGSYSQGEMRAFRTVQHAPAQPDLVYLDGGGNEVALSDYRGQIILVNFWATWCAPCVEEMPALNNLQATLGGEDFQVVTISLDRSIEDARNFYERMDVTHLPLIHDAGLASPSRVAIAGMPLGLPISILYDRQGREIGRVAAPAVWDSEDAYALIRAAIRQY